MGYNHRRIDPSAAWAAQLLAGWTEADVYVEVTRRWLAMSAKGEPAGPDPAIEALLREQHRRWWRRRRKIQIPERRLVDRRK